jgi:hypothetical protein
VEGIPFAHFRARMRACLDEQQTLLADVSRSWTLPGRQKGEHYIARLGFRPHSILPILVVHTIEPPSQILDTNHGVPIDHLSLAGVEKYTSLLRSVAEWRRGRAVLPDGDVHPEGTGHQATSTP